MAIDRRQMLIGSLAAIGAARAGLIGGASADIGAAHPGAIYASAARYADNSYGVLLIAEDGRVLREISLTARGHDIAIDPRSRRAVVFARRPGFFALAFDLDGKREPHVFAPPDNRHFYGHGVFARDGRHIYATEHDIDTGDGVIGIYDVAAGWKRVGEHPSYGMGPHEAILLSDGVTLAIANGGFGSDPATGRESIDIAGMQPNIAFVDLASGACKACHGLPQDINLLSIRHLAQSAQGDVWFGGQWQGGMDEAPPLIGRASLDKPVRLIDGELSPGIALKGYIGSVTMSADGRFLAASAPRADRVVLTDTETGRVVREVSIDDGCGVAASGSEEFAMSTGKGVVRLGHDGGIPPDQLLFSGTEFDNHLRRV